MSYRHSWRWTLDEELLFRSLSIGFVLHVCCGESEIGDIKVDLFSSNCDVKADVRKLPFRPLSFDTVICDPPWALYNKFKWVLKLNQLARERLILITPNYWLRFPDYQITSVLILENKTNPPNTTFKRCMTCKICWVYDRIKPPNPEWLKIPHHSLESFLIAP